MHRVVGLAHLMLQDSRVALLPLKANTDGGLVVLQVDLLACYAAVIRYSAAIAFQHLVRLLMADRAALRLGRGSPVYHIRLHALRGRFHLHAGRSGSQLLFPARLCSSLQSFHTKKETFATIRKTFSMMTKTTQNRLQNRSPLNMNTNIGRFNNLEKYCPILGFRVENCTQTSGRSRAKVAAESAGVYSGRDSGAPSARNSTCIFALFRKRGSAPSARNSTCILALFRKRGSLFRARQQCTICPK